MQIVSAVSYTHLDVYKRQSLWLVVTYALGYLMMYMTPGIISYLMLEPAMVLRGQVWRLVTWVLIPPSTGNI